MEHIKSYRDNLRKSISSSYHNLESTEGAYSAEVFEAIWGDEYFTERNVQALKKSLEPTDLRHEELDSFIAKSIIMPNGSIQKVYVVKDFEAKSEAELNEDFVKGEEHAVLGEGGKAIYLFEKKGKEEA